MQDRIVIGAVIFSIIVYIIMFYGISKGWGDNLTGKDSWNKIKS